MDDMRQSAHSTPALLRSRKARCGRHATPAMATARLRVVAPDAWPASCVRAHGFEVVRALTIFLISSERI
jgi:hypothetical protein